MRMFMSVRIPTDSGNAAITNGTLPQVMGKFLDTFKPEAAYFITVDGDRCAHFYVDLKDVSVMPSIAEPLFMQLGAKVTYCPAMNPQDLQKGITAFMSAS